MCTYVCVHMGVRSGAYSMYLYVCASLLVCVFVCVHLCLCVRLYVYFEYVLAHTEGYGILTHMCA